MSASHEAQARARKVLALVAVLDNLPEDQRTAEALAAWPARSWEIVATIADVRPPSAKTVAAIVEHVAHRERIRRALDQVVVPHGIAIHHPPGHRDPATRKLVILQPGEAQVRQLSEMGAGL